VWKHQRHAVSLVFLDTQEVKLCAKRKGNVWKATEYSELLRLNIRALLHLFEDEEIRHLSSAGLRDIRGCLDALTNEIGLVQCAVDFLQSVKGDEDADDRGLAPDQEGV